jgi:nitrate/TMAO reductase-like tetraheme cytochrome c subunit
LEGIEWQPVTWEFDSSNGCLSCHGNPLLKKMASGGGKSYQVTEVDSSVHRDLTCQQCHVDYRYDDKPSSTPLWTINASKACADCHKKANTGDPEKDKRLSEPVEAYDKSIHAEAIVEGNLESATCGSCHGGHFIYSTETASGAARMHQSAYRVCARCKQHGDEYDTYDDYYHGKAYKSGAPDSPSCWDCHASHEVQPRSDTESTVNDANVGATCGQEGCHKGSSDKFGANAAALIHQKIEAQEQNPLLRLIARIRGR